MLALSDQSEEIEPAVNLLNNTISDYNDSHQSSTALKNEEYRN
jgi:hypothetical protein